MQEKGESNELMTCMEIGLTAKHKQVATRQIYLCHQKKSSGRLSGTGTAAPWSSWIPASSVFQPEDHLTLQDGYWRFSHHGHILGNKESDDGEEKHTGSASQQT